MALSGLTIAYLVIFHAFLSSADFFSKSTFSRNSFRNTIRLSNSLDPDLAGRLIGPDLGLNCLQRLSADGTRRQRMLSGLNIFNNIFCLYQEYMPLGYTTFFSCSTQLSIKFQVLIKTKMLKNKECS